MTRIIIRKGISVFCTICIYFTFSSFSFSQTHSTHEKMYFELFALAMDSVPHKGEQIIFYSDERKKQLSVITDEDGKVSSLLPWGHWIVYAKKLSVRKKIYEFWIQKKIRGTYPDTRVKKTYDWDEKIKLSIRFESGKFQIQESSYKSLDEIAGYLHRNSNLNIEVIGHTDNKGLAKDNMVLSKNRADAIKSYLVKKGIAENRITTIGKGDTEPIASNDTEKGRSLNRRTEFREY